MNIVWLVQNPTNGADITPASKYGEIKTIFSFDERPSITPGPCLHKARKVLKEFQDGDFLFWAGADPVAIGLVNAVLGEMRVNYKFLEYTKEDEGYNPIEIILRKD